MFYGMYNLGFNANEALAAGLCGLESWRGWLIETFWPAMTASSIWQCFWYGAVFFLPIYITTFVVGIAWEILFASQTQPRGERGLLCNLYPVCVDLSAGYSPCGR